jgi:excisionase family DNA binding protein
MSKKRTKVKIFSALEVANICGVVNQTAINWIRNGYLKAFNTPGGQYRVYAEDLLSFLKSRGMRVADEILEMLSNNAERNILLVLDSDRTLSDALKALVESQLPYLTVIQAFDSFDAGRMLAETKPGIVLLSLDLPGVNGREIAWKIKNDPGLGKPWVIAFAEGEAPADGVLAGWADVLLSKPLDLDRLILSIRDLEKKDKPAAGA